MQEKEICVEGALSRGVAIVELYARDVIDQSKARNLLDRLALRLEDNDDAEMLEAAERISALSILIERDALTR